PVGNFEPPSHINAAINRDLDSVILKSLSRKPSLRYQTVDEFQQAILAATEESRSVHANVQKGPFPNSSIPNQPAVSVPFQCEGMNGFSMVHGAVQANEGGLRVEYRSQDAFFGTWKSKLRTLELPWNRLVRVELKPGVFESKLQIYGDTFSLFEDFPGTEGGYLTVKVKKQNQYLSERFVERVRQYHPSVVCEFSHGALKPIPTNLTIALLLIICSFLNAGILAILQVAAVESGFASSIKAMLAVAISVCIGPLVLIQLLTGMIYGSTGISKIGQVGVVASMLPLSPLFVFTLPFASWAKNELSGNPARPNLPSQAQYPRWGVTTMIFMKESRHATLVSALESAGGVILVAVIALWFLGAYPTKMQYRVAGNVSQKDLKQFIEQRLYDHSNVDIVIDSEQRFTIGCWRYQRNPIADRLAITEKPKLLKCVSSEDASTLTESSHASTDSQTASDPARYVPIFEGDFPKGLVHRNSNFGNETPIEKELPWEDSWLSEVQKVSNSKLSITWSKMGLTAFREQMADSPDPILAIQINGWIEAVAGPGDFKDRSISFQWLSGTKRSLESIQSAMRGPSLSAELELLN
ncbi:MAG: hypothetical protein MUC83_10315, partial [Pirellula sp.]|nr:hypothetical protein [Pirellula sp.]